MPSQSPSSSIESKILYSKDLTFADFNIPNIPDQFSTSWSLFLGEFDLSNYAHVACDFWYFNAAGNAGVRFDMLVTDSMISFNTPTLIAQFLNPGQGVSGTASSRIVFSRFGSPNYLNLNKIDNATITGIQAASDPALQNNANFLISQSVDSMLTVTKLYLYGRGLDIPRRNFEASLKITGVIV